MDYKQQAEEFAAFLMADTSKGQRKRKGDKIEGRCPNPAHEDVHPSFSYTIGIDAWACSCDAGKGSELRKLLNWGNGSNGHEIASPRPNVGVLAPMPFTPPPTRPPDCIHPYQNGNRKLKWRTPGEKSRIVWEHLEGSSWKSGKQGETGLYNADKLPTADTIYLSESESDADALTALGLVASCHGYGAASNIKNDDLPTFKRKRVPILEHNDEPGIKWASAQLQLLTLAGADAWIVHMPEGTKDIRDYITAGADRFAVEFLVSCFEPKDLIAETAPVLFERTPDFIDWILEPLISKGCIVQLQGTPKIGKSGFALLLALSCALGRWTSGRFNYVGGARRTLYLGYEDSARRMKRRARAYLVAMGVTDSFPDSLLMFQRAPTLDLGTDDGRARLEKIVRQNKLEVLVIDTLSWVATGNENDKSAMQPVLATLRYIAEEYGTAIVLLHHTRKTSQAGDMASVSERGRGSSAIAAAADSILDFVARVSKNHTLCKFVSKDADEEEFVTVYDNKRDDGGIGWTIEDVVEREDSVLTKQRIIDAITSLSATSTEITVSLIHETMKDLSINTVRGYVKVLADTDKLTITKGKNRAKFYSLKSPK